MVHLLLEHELRILAFCAAFAATSASAECNGRTDVFRFVADSLSSGPGNGIGVEYQIMNATERAISGADGWIKFTDPLDRELTAFSIPDWPNAGPGEATTGYGLAGKLLDAGDLYTATVCVEAVIYPDGSTERFN
jgi:hypothetical protein